MSKQVAVRSAQKTRILSPDVARGLALLGIAMANVSTAWITAPSTATARSIGGIVHDSIFEKIYAVIATMFIHVRGLPMFSTLLGYGVGMIVYSLWRRQYPDTSARGVLLRRYGFLALFGIIHMIFLFWGDIMFFYGVAGMTFALLMTLKDKALWWIAGVMAVVYALFGIGLGVILPLVVDFSADQSTAILGGATSSYWGYLGVGLLSVPLQIGAVPVEMLMLMPVMIVGYIAARHRVLSRVDEFRKPLWIATWVFIAIAVLVGIPWGLAEIGVFSSQTATVFSGLNQAIGALTGPGIVAAVALLVQPLQRKINEGNAALPLPVKMIAALGARSMSGYVGQSILFLIFAQTFTLGIGQGGGILAGAGVAICVWLVTLLAAYGLEVAGKRGPFEAVHRYMAYGKKGLQDPYVPKQLPSSYQQIPGTEPLGKASDKYSQGD
ncbi:hypothetical protein N24_1984 [Corynebacterium suranareeae]|uniref:DUF418 domain-containing protein n=1 Tax=Corynebacterium suranareeae TaxID=2506452 RepID=A0A160PRH0_9CORY|nr:DUF418 domain-containing protein [Corynebacterium suranareeae]BAU96246.1 hypothetical protein N24_1984 [Corynebacterium suranareeae]